MRSLRDAAASFIVLLSLAGLGACRAPLCVQTLQGNCPCRGPAGTPPDETATYCFTSIEIVACGTIDAAVDPCSINPCCEAPLPADGSTDLPAATDLRHADDLSHTDATPDATNPSPPDAPHDAAPHD